MTRNDISRPGRRVRTKVPAGELVPLFDCLPGVVFFVKDTMGRYTHANLALVRRLGLESRAQVIGKAVGELFPDFMARSYAAQDRRVLRGNVIEDLLEVHLFNKHVPGWCVTMKRPLITDGKVRGLIGISRDLGTLERSAPTYGRLREVLDYMRGHFGEGLRVTILAKVAGVSVSQLERLFRYAFQLTPQQMLTKLRIDSALRLLHGDETVAAIGLACGFADHSAFARQFRVTVGMTPRDYRQLVGPGAGAGTDLH